MAYVANLPDIRFIASLLAGYQSDREALTGRLAQGRDAVLSEVNLLALEASDDLLEAGAVLDALALSCTPGPYLPGRRCPRAAIRQQLLELPGPVVAAALGYHDKTTSRLIRETGGTWSRYAPGDHARSPTGWLPRGTSGS
ncbi:hypothetical protein [Streptomyces sp. KS 21]|uniref:hypothetical protein n=1 Tax=Streptomyces sp. KS 21 TaxID=2485150 RepID=UPI0010E3A435|nr:hypothetical protein [Streptomyces sp. KS 21]TDU67113.1 hypothetical protein EDD91_8146 [Streptomyces sp. KS 21]